jgi:hypothetical protein
MHIMIVQTAFNDQVVMHGENPGTLDEIASVLTKADVLIDRAIFQARDIVDIPPVTPTVHDRALIHWFQSRQKHDPSGDLLLPHDLGSPWFRKADQE